MVEPVVTALAITQSAFELGPGRRINEGWSKQIQKITMFLIASQNLSVLNARTVDQWEKDEKNRTETVIR
jgi:hypothetical protein